MAKVLHEPETQNGQESEFARFQRAIKTILQVPKDDVVGQEKLCKATREEEKNSETTRK